MPEIYASKEDRYWAKLIVETSQTYLYEPKLICNHFFTKNGATWKEAWISMKYKILFTSKNNYDLLENWIKKILSSILQT